MTCSWSANRRLLGSRSICCSTSTTLRSSSTWSIASGSLSRASEWIGTAGSKRGCAGRSSSSKAGSSPNRQRRNVQIRVIADDSLAVDRFGFERVCHRAAGGLTVTGRYVADADLADAVREARRSGDGVLLCASAHDSSDDLRATVI